MYRGFLPITTVKSSSPPLVRRYAAQNFTARRTLLLRLILSVYAMYTALYLIVDFFDYACRSAFNNDRSMIPPLPQIA